MKFTVRLAGIQCSLLGRTISYYKIYSLDKNIFNLTVILEKEKLLYVSVLCLKND